MIHRDDLVLWSRVRPCSYPGMIVMISSAVTSIVLIVA
jgi:hypothetical protein